MENPRRRFALFKALHARQHVEGFGDFLNGGTTDDWFTCGEAIEKSVVAKVVDVARNAFRAAEDVVDRPRRKNVRRLGPGNLEPAVNVLGRLFDVGQSLNVAAQGHALFELAQIGIVQDRAQFRLTGQNDL